MKRTIIFERAVLLAAFVLLPCAALAQEKGDMMSFSEDEAETGQKEEAPTDEAAAAPAPSSGGSSDAEIAAALGGGTEGGLSASASASGGKAGDKKAADELEQHPIWAVQQVYALRKGRVDFQPTFGVSMNDPYVQHQSVSRAAHQTIPINRYLLGGQLNFSYVPMYGKFAFIKDWILHWDVWVIGGGGFIMTRPEPVIDPEYRSFDFKAKFSFNVGLGGRLFLTRFAAIVLELRDYIYPEELENLTNYSRVEDRQNPKNWLQDEFKLTNNVTLHAGISLFIPFTFEYELPK